MPSYFFPFLFLVPEFEGSTLEFDSFSVHRRLWTTSTFDLATLATKHRLHLPYQLMDVYLGHCNLEVEFKAAEDTSEAADDIQIIRALLYLYGTAMFAIPFYTTYSVNQYSGINSRDSDSLRKKMPDGMREGITSKTATVEAWPLDLTLQLVSACGETKTSQPLWAQVASQWQLWKSLEAQYPILNIARRILNSAPTIADIGPSILEIWQAVETLFPTVTSEVSFRLAVLVSQLCTPLRNPGVTYRDTKKKYGVRSKITHGSTSKVSSDDWVGAWDTLCTCLRSVIERKKLPSEDDLLAELLPS
jgi:hypothetical protein